MSHIVISTSLAVMILTVAMTAVWRHIRSGDNHCRLQENNPPN